jgi:hypothetical protein
VRMWFRLRGGQQNLPQLRSCCISLCSSPKGVHVSHNKSALLALCVLAAGVSCLNPGDRQVLLSICIPLKSPTPSILLVFGSTSVQGAAPPWLPECCAVALVAVCQEQES